MARKSGRHLIIVIFPYLFIHNKEGFAFEDILLKPSNDDTINQEKEDVKENLLNIARLFRFGRDKQIYQWSYVLAYISSQKQWTDLKDKLNRFATILRYSHLCDRKERGRFEHFNFFMFEITKSQSFPEKKFAYFQGLLNGESSFGFNMVDGVIANPYRPLTDFHPELITTEELKNNQYMIRLHLYKGLLTGDEDAKILRAMEWFNRSYSHYGRGVDLSEAVLNVHTAIEALLRPEDDERAVKSQIKTALLNLLGHSEQLSKWLDSFWKLRNSIVHGDIKPESLLYIHHEGSKGHRRHLDIAREIFVKSLEIILKIRAEYPLLGLEQELVSNEVRIKKALKLLTSDSPKSIEQLARIGIFDFVSGLRTDDISADKKKTKFLGELLLPFVKEDLEKNEKPELSGPMLKIIDEILKWKGENLGDLALIYSKLEQQYESVYFKDIIDFPIYYLALRGAVYNFFGFATWHFLTMFD